MKNYIWLWAITAALSGFLFGFDTAVISGAEQAIQAVWSMSIFEHGLAMSAALWGTVFGALLGGIPNDRLGRKPTLLIIGVLYTISAIGCALAWSAPSFMLFRFIGGIGIGGSSIAAPIYISEIAPAAKRGRLVALFQFNIVFGILIAYVSNYLIAHYTGGGNWRWMLAAAAIPAVAFTLAAIAIPESPRWLIMRRGRFKEAHAIFAKADPSGEQAMLSEGDGHGMSLREFFSGRYNRPITLAMLLAFFNQLSGINGVVYYAPRIFELAGGDKAAALLSTVGIGCVLVIFTGIGMAAIDRFGRRTLVIVGSIGYIVALGMIARGFYLHSFAQTPLFIFLFIAAHAVGQGAVIWVYIAEIFPNAARSIGQSLGAGTHWVMAAMLTFAMPFFLESMPPWIIFAVFAAVMAVQLVFALFVMVETRGRSLEELSATLIRKEIA